jgi:phosphoribosylamine-glycine ligase
MLTPTGPKVIEFNVRFGDPSAGRVAVTHATAGVWLMAAAVAN